MMTKKMCRHLTWTVLLLTLAGAVPAPAAGPTLRTCKTFADFLPGKLETLSLASNGHLTLAAQTKQLVDTGEPYVWDVASDAAGNLFLATGNAGKVFKISVRGDSSLFFKADEPEIYALAHDGRGSLYVATSPNGCIYKVDARGKAAIFCEPKQTYIWDMLFDAHGDLWIATGGKARLLRVTADGRITVVLASEAEHLRCLARDGDTIYAGSSRPGLVYRIRKDFNPFVLCDTGMEEVHALAAIPGGPLYAGTLTASSPAASLDRIFGASIVQTQATSAANESDQGAANTLETLALAEEAAPANFKTQLLRINAEGYSRNIWPLEQDEVLSLLADSAGQVLVGTGREGKLYSISGSGDISLLQKIGATQISAMHRTAGKRLVLATSNLGLGFCLEARGRSGRYESETLDAAALASWGALSWLGTGKIVFQTRSGNTQKPEGSWSAWQPLTGESGVSRIASPPARFLQWRCDLQEGDAQPELEQVTIAYIQKNIAPEILDLIVLPAGDYFDTSQDHQPAGEGIADPPPIPKRDNKKGFRSAIWQFNDPNHDPLLFALLYRRVGDAHWRHLAGPVAHMIYSWDTTQMADGEYQLKVVASDSLALPAGMGAQTEKVSDIFSVDNTGPTIKIGNQGAGKVLEFTVCDAASPVGRVRVSVNASGWKSIYPLDGICDSLCEHFCFPLEGGNAPLEVTIEAADLFDNSGVAHQQIKGF